ncbi:MAG TPA: c-type cytochrome [Casimicrobiaceae bacterium]|nr:c-type cytochrome [Casimicrobiaceae bacterium]
MSDEHSSFIKTPKQLAIVVALAFAIPVTLIVLLSQLVTGITPGSGSQSEAEVLDRIQPVGRVTLAEAKAATGSKSGEQVYQAVCKTCHEAGLAGAPKFGDKAAWSARINAGIDALYASAIKGKNAMPPRGGSPDLSDLELERAVVYMANRAGASFKEPPAPTSPAAPAASSPPPVAAAAASPVPAAAAAPASAGPLDLGSATALMQKDGCAACHAVDKKIVGPAYQDVAAKYRGDKDAFAKLVQKVKTGGAGVWGTIPMPPNAQAPDADVRALVSWILTLKK